MITIKNKCIQSDNGNRNYLAVVDVKGNSEELCVEVYTLFKCFMKVQPEMLNACISSILPDITESLNTCSEDKMACFMNLIQDLERNGIL